MMEKNLYEGGLVHRVPRAKSREKEFFQSACMLFCKELCTVFQLVCVSF